MERGKERTNFWLLFALTTVKFPTIGLANDKAIFSP
jgi:hypothetical protein